MTKRILNAEKPVEEPVKPKKQQVKKIWYRVAIFKKTADEYYTLITNNDNHVTYYQRLAGFVRWEPGVEVEV